MSHLTCETCGHSKMVRNAAWGEDLRLRCMRTRTARDGTEMHHDGVGSDPETERDDKVEPHRKPVDKCYPHGLWWTPKAEFKAI
jgi:hypothetical protein